MEVPAPSAFDTLPDGVLSLVLEHLGLQNAAAARGACRRFRETIEAVVWSRVDVACSSPERADQLASLLRQPGEQTARTAGSAGDPSACRRWIRVAAGASFRAAVKEAAAAGGRTYGSYEFECYGFEFGSSWERPIARTPWAAALALVSACVAASGGLSSVEVDCRRSRSACTGDLLGALSPPSGAPAAGRALLRSLAIGGDYSFDCFGLPAGLGEQLRGFPNLESLALPDCCTADAAASSAIARCLPRLKRASLFLRGYGDAAPLASLPALERLEVKCGPQDPAPLVSGLAAGPAARSLRELHFSSDLTAGALRALPRLVALERIHGYFMVDFAVSADDVACLGACPALRSLGTPHLYPDGDEGAPLRFAEQLAGLRAALERSPKLVLDLYFNSQPSTPGAVAAVAGSRGRPPAGAWRWRRGSTSTPPRAAPRRSPPPSPPPRPAACASASRGPEDLAGGRLASLSAFAACSLEPLQVRLSLVGALEGDEAAEAAARAAAASSLPSARLLPGPARG
eukprot:tig00021312_g20099.t1